MSSNRNTLKKKYFRAGVIPREEHFAELIDNTLNQEDDGIKKSADTALQLQAEPEQGVALLLYADFFATDGQPAEPDWVIKVGTRDGMNPGLNFANAVGESRLFLDQGTGRIGIGIATPEKLLHVAGEAQIDGHLGLKDMEVAGEVSIGGKLGIGLADDKSPLHPLQVGGSAQVDDTLFARELEVAEKATVKGELHANTDLFVQNRLGIGIEDLSAQEQILQVGGSAKITEHLETRQLAVLEDTALQGPLLVNANLLVNENIGVGLEQGAEPDASLHVVGTTRLEGNVIATEQVEIGKELIATKLRVTGKAIFEGDLQAEMIQSALGDLVPVGTIVAYGGSAAPAGWLMCNKADLTTDDKYSALREVVGDFTPDLQGRFIIGSGNYNLNNDEGGQSGNVEYTLNQKGGKSKVKLELSQMPSHSHNVNDSGHNHANGSYKRLLQTQNDSSNKNVTAKGFDSGGTNELNIKSGGTIQSAKANISETAKGGGQHHENLPPFFALTYIIKY